MKSSTPAVYGALRNRGTDAPGTTHVGGTHPAATTGTAHARNLFYSNHSRLCRLLLALFILAPAIPARAQLTGTMAYLTEHHFKGWAMCAVPGADHYMMAGTLYSDTTDMRRNAIALIRVDEYGYHVFPFEIIDALDQDERVMDIDAVNSNRFIITTLLRDADYQGVPRDVIRLIEVNGSGLVLDERSLVASLTALDDPVGGSVSYRNWYPQNALVDGNNFLIVGYGTEASTAFPNQPMWGPPRRKRFFAISYNLTTRLVNNWQTYNTRFISAANSSPNYIHDYDIATRVIRIQNGNLAGNFFVTGMCNVSTYNTISSTQEFPCATLSFAMNAAGNTVAALGAGNSIQPFVRHNAYSTDGIGECGVGMMEHFDSATNTADMYIIGNSFKMSIPATDRSTEPGNNWHITRVSLNDLTLNTAFLSRIGIASDSFTSA